MTRSRIIFASTAILMLAVLLGLVLAGRRFYYVAIDVGGHGIPTRLLSHPEEVGIAGLTTVELVSRDGTALSAWYLPSANGASIVLSTGTDANRAAMLPEFRILASEGFGVLAFDWPGTGLSGGRVNWGDGAVAALEGAIDWLEKRPEGNPAKLGAFGFSGGGFVTAHVAATDSRLSAVALSGTASGLEESADWIHMSQQHPLKAVPGEWAARFFGWPVGRQRPVDQVGKIAPRSLLIIGGSDDPDAGPASCAELYAAAGDPKEMWIAPGASHGNYFDTAPVEYRSRLSKFFARALKITTPQNSGTLASTGAAR